MTLSGPSSVMAGCMAHGAGTCGAARACESVRREGIHNLGTERDIPPHPCDRSDQKGLEPAPALVSGSLGP
ncbi:unnamed protein product [Pleuronectes platessa]|uniref:Uncharacterized protein n=1 Tax=Pleuronectes platessa TaxID=8262 RepID=A0A9N7UPT9_PLEPL|nr:unnamed protein product [Pleuronectes platessa]